MLLWSSFGTFFLVFDEELWQSRLSLSDSTSFNTLYLLFEKCDREVFPILQDEAYEQSRRDPLQGTMRITHLVQWMLLPAKKKRAQSQKILRQSLGASTTPIATALRRLETVFTQSACLPALHQTLLRGALFRVLRWFEDKRPEYSSQLKVIQA